MPIDFQPDTVADSKPSISFTPDPEATTTGTNQVIDPTPVEYSNLKPAQIEPTVSEVVAPLTTAVTEPKEQDKTFMSQLSVKVPEVIEEYGFDFPNKIEGLSDSETAQLNSLKKDLVLKEATKRVRESKAKSIGRSAVQFTSEAIQSLPTAENLGLMAASVAVPAIGVGTMAGLAAKAIGTGAGTLSTPGIGVGQATKEILNMGLMTLGAVSTPKVAEKIDPKSKALPIQKPPISPVLEELAPITAKVVEPVVIQPEIAKFTEQAQAEAPKTVPEPLEPVTVPPVGEKPVLEPARGQETVSERVPEPKPVEKGVEPSAIQIESPATEVLQPTRPEMELPRVGERDSKPVQPAEPRPEAQEPQAPVEQIAPEKVAEVPSFAAKYDPETLMQRPAWVEPGSKLDRVLGDLREGMDPHKGTDIAPIWKKLTPEQRQDLVARGWITVNDRNPNAVVLKIAQDVVPARKYYGMQSKLESKAQPGPAEPAPTEVQTTPVNPSETRTVTDTAREVSGEIQPKPLASETAKTVQDKIEPDPSQPQTSPESIPAPGVRTKGSQDSGKPGDAAIKALEEDELKARNELDTANAKVFTTEYKRIPEATDADYAALGKAQRKHIAISGQLRDAKEAAAREKGTVMAPVSVEATKQLSRSLSQQTDSTYNTLIKVGISGHIARWFEGSGLDPTLENLSFVLSTIKTPDFPLPIIDSSGRIKGLSVLTESGEFWPKISGQITTRTLDELQGSASASSKAFSVGEPEKVGPITRSEQPLIANRGAPETEQLSFTKSQPADVQAQRETKPADAVVQKPEQVRTPEQTLGSAREVKVSAPSGATQIRVTDTKGRISVQPLSELKKSNPFQGVDIAKIEPGTIERGGKFKPMEGEVKVEPKQNLAGPGSPSIEQGPDPKAAIDALEESFRNIKGPKPTLQEQVKEAFAIGDRASAAKDTFSKALQGLKSTGDYLIKKWEGVPSIDDMLRAKGELSAEIEKRGWRLRQFVKTVQKAMPTKRQRAAVLKWVDAGGDAAELKRGFEETPEQFKQAYKDALELKGDDLVAARNIQSYFEQRLDDAIEAGVLEEGVTDYIHRIYERNPKLEKQALAYVQSSILSQNPALAKKRIFQFDWEAEKAGLKPVQDFLPRIAQYEASLSRAIAARKFVQKMTQMQAKDGRPVLDVAGLGVPIEDAAGVREATLIKPSFKPGDAEIELNNRRDFVEKDYPALRKWKWVAPDSEGNPIYVQGNLLVHPDFVGRVDALLEPSKVKYGRYPRLGKTALGASSTVKQTMLDLSGFHQVQITVHGMEHKVLPWKIVKDIDLENPNVDGLLKGGITLGGEYYAQHASEGLIGSSLSRHVPFLGPLLESYHSWLFQSYIPRIKMSMALNALERNRSRYPGMTEEQIFNKTASEANSAFGELNYTMLERSKTARDISRLIMLAPDFLEARGRFAAGALEKGGKLGSHEQRAALLLGALTMWVTARIANKLVDDKWHFEPENAFSVVHDGHAYSLRTVQGDIMHLLEKPISFWIHRLNPVYGRPVLELATGRDEFGRKRSVPEVVWDTVSNMVPISLRSSKERKLWESMLNSMGVTARRWNDVDKAFELAKDWKKANGVEERGEFIYDRDKDDLRGLKIALSRGDDGQAVKEIKDLLESKKITRKKLNDYFDRYAAMPFTGSRSNDKKFLSTLTEDQAKIVEGARQHKKSIRDLYIKARGQYDAARPLSPAPSL